MFPHEALLERALKQSIWSCPQGGPGQKPCFVFPRNRIRPVVLSTRTKPQLLFTLQLVEISQTFVRQL